MLLLLRGVLQASLLLVLLLGRCACCDLLLLVICCALRLLLELSQGLALPIAAANRGCELLLRVMLPRLGSAEQLLLLGKLHCCHAGELHAPVPLSWPFTRRCRQRKRQILSRAGRCKAGAGTRGEIPCYQKLLALGHGCSTNSK
jgi:hypothetical protein